MNSASIEPFVPDPADPYAYFHLTMQRLIQNARRDLALAQANGQELTAVRAHVRLDTLTAALAIHRASPIVAARVPRAESRP